MKYSIYLLVVVLGLFLVGCAKAPNNAIGNTDTVNSVVSLSGNLSSQELKKFNSVEELQQFLAERSTSQSQNLGGVRSLMMEKSMDSVTSAAPSVASGNGAADYSQTNVQVKGVDEADFVKNDDRYIYMITANKLLIVDALDAKNADIISTTKFSDDSTDYLNARELFIDKDKLVVFAEASEKAYYFQKYDIRPQPTYKPVSFVYIYDISDRKKPVMLEKYTVSGSYFSSRLIEDKVYLVTQDPINDYVYLEAPLVRSDAKIIRPDIYYFDNPDENYQFNTITSLSLSSNDVVDSKTFMLGYANTLMVSENNIYIAYQKHNYWCWGWRCINHNTDDKKRFYDVVVPLLKGDLKTDINDIMDQGLDEDKQWTEISQTLSTFYSKMEKDQNLQDQYEEMFTKIEAALDEYDAKKALENEKTVIQKIPIADGRLGNPVKGEVDGSLLNQFSMDENKGYFRVATTVNVWLNSRRLNYNNVYVLDDSMDVVGKAEGIAENESIYSTRFMGDKLYMVTFRQMDPFFVIDLSNPKAPEVLGKLKIPGYSSYLHPFKENFIIGIGKETGENQWGGTSTKGVKVSLFDVSDFENPKEVDKYEIGMEGSDSPILYDHKAFMFSTTKDIMVLPVTEITQKDKLNQYNYRQKIWHGAYVFKVTENGFELLGKVKHSSMDSDYFNWWNQASVTRSLYLDDNLYTISQKYIKINDLADSLKELNSIDLPTDNVDKGYPVPYIAMDSVATSAGSSGAPAAE
jgi:inhibitor of cysteine peptidase